MDIKSISRRLMDLEGAVQRRQVEQRWPVDPLSRSLEKYSAELASLDTLGKAALLGELNRCGDTLDSTMGVDLSPEALDRMIWGMK